MTTLLIIGVKADPFKEQRRVDTFRVPLRDNIKYGLTKPNSTAVGIDPSRLTSASGKVMVPLVVIPNLLRP